MCVSDLCVPLSCKLNHIGTNIMRIFIFFLCTMAAGIALAGKKSGIIRLRPNTYTFSEMTASENRFSLKATVHLTESMGDTTLFALPNLLSVRFRHHDPNDTHRQNYPAGRMKDGSVPVLEAGLMLRLPDNCTLVREGQPKEQEMVIGVPLGLLDRPYGTNELLLNYNGIAWDLYIDGHLMDRDYTLGTPPTAVETSAGAGNEMFAQWELRGPQEATVSATTTHGKRKTDESPVQYFTPRGHNAWVGDVATIWHKGRYHVFYLLDRRGHESKFGRGGHYFEHLSTKDFRHWTEHEAATPIEEQWETFGTGTPFVWHDSLFLSYGMHTSRIFPAELTATPRQNDYLRQHKESEAIRFDHPYTAANEYPSGASYSASPDGVAHFAKSRVLIHPAENPTIYTDSEGKLCMLANYGARGMWTSKKIEGGWQCLSEDFPPGGDCTFIFPWGCYEYIVGGFTRQWMKRRDEPIEAYRDMVAEGLDLYDGLSVPSICEIKDGRRLMAGWVETNRHWGGPLVIRELIQYPDGRLGSHFVPELMPATKGKKLHGEKAKHLQSEKNYLVTFNVVPNSEGTLVLTFSAEDNSKHCQWTLDTKHLTARFGNGTSLRQGGQPHRAGDFAIEHIEGMKKTFPVRIVLRGERKMGGTLIDIEIAGQRTMISHRSELQVNRLDFLHGEAIGIKNLTTQEIL